MDPNISLVFETIGQIKKSLQCSICLELLSDPHSTRCNHQFCSHCIRKVVDERRDKHKEALCPLCKNPITKRSLFSNPRLKDIVDVVRRLNISFKQDAKLPNSPYPLVHQRTPGQSESYLQFVSSHPTPQKPFKRKSSPGGNDETHPLNSTCADGSIHDRSLSPDDVPAIQRSRDDAVSTSITRETGAEILALLETDVVSEAETSSKSEGADLVDNQENLRENENDKSEGKKNTSHGEKAIISENDHDSDLSTMEVARSSQDSSVTGNSVSMLECLMFNQSEDDARSKADESYEQASAVESICDEPNSNDKTRNEKPVKNRCIDAHAVINEPAKTSFGKDDSGGSCFRATSRHASCGIIETTDDLVESEEEAESEEEDFFEVHSSAPVPASMESLSSTCDVLHIPRIQEFVSEDEISFTLSSPCAKPRDVENHEPDMEMGNPPIVKVRGMNTHVHVKRLSPSQQYGPDALESHSKGRSVSVPPPNNCDYSEALFLSPSYSSSSLRCQAMKRKYDSGDEDEERTSEERSEEQRAGGRKCRRLNQKERRTSKNYKTSIDDKLPEKCMEEEIFHNISNTKPETARSPVKSATEPFDFPVPIRACRLASARDRPTVKLVDQNLDTTSRYQLTQTADNNMEDDIVPPTPPVRMDLSKPSPENAHNFIEELPPKSRTTQEGPAVPNGTDTDDIERTTFDLNRDLDDDDDQEVMVVDQVRSPVENDLSSSEDDLRFEDEGTCDQDNIGLLRTLAPSSAKCTESENESDEEASDCRTTDTTSISSFTEGDGIGMSSQREQYLHQVVAKTGGEIEKLTADLITLRNNGTTEQTVEKEVDEVESEKEDEDDDERQSCSSLSPPPSLEPSALSLTKMPPAIRDMQMLLRQNSDNESEPPAHADRFSSDPWENRRRVNAQVRKTRHSDTNANQPRAERVDGADNPASGSNATKENSEKENDSDRPRRCVTNNNSSDNDVYDSKKRHTKLNGESYEKVLAEHRTNRSRNSNTATSKLCNGGVKDLGLKRLNTLVRPAVSFVVTRLPKQFVSLAGHLAKRAGGKLTIDLTSETTHIIMPTDSQMYASRKNYTIKYLTGVALGKWIVSQLWLTACVKSGKLVDEKPYEVKGDPEAAQSHVPCLARTTRETKGSILFDGVSLVCFGNFNGAISKFHITQLVQFCGGQIIDSKEEAVSKKTSDLVVVVEPVISKPTTLLVKDFCETYNTFPVSAEWVTDSVANYQLQDIEEYRLGWQEI